MVIAGGLTLGNFYTNKYINSFINNILLFKNKNVRFFIKNKRKVNGVCKGYENNLRNLKDKNKVTFIKESITPERIIKQANLVISPVYSTPALIAKYLKIPSIYYDPSGEVDKKFIFNRDIPIVSKDIITNITKIYQAWQK